MHRSPIVRPRRPVALGIILATGLAIIVGCNSSQAPIDRESPSPGEPVSSSTSSASDDQSPSAGEISLEDADRARYDEVLASRRGDVILVDFWATWCGPCTKEFPRTVEMARKYGDRGLSVVSVSLDDPASRDAVLKFLHQQGATFTNLLSQHGLDDKSFEEFQIEGGAIPHYKIYDRGGAEIRSFVSGDPTAPPFDYDQVESAIQEALEGS